MAVLNLPLKSKGYIKLGIKTQGQEEELLILRGFLEFTSRRGTAFASHQYDTGPFYEEIRRKLSFDFSKNQLIEKLRRLKKKYRVCATRMAAQGAAFAFKSVHEGAIYDVARHIWRSAFKRDGVATTSTPQKQQQSQQQAPPPRAAPRERRLAAREPAIAAFGSSVAVIAQPPSVPAAPLPPYPLTANGLTEADVRSILSPLLKELINSVAFPGQTGLGLGLGMGFGGADILGVGLGVAGLSPRVPGDEKWRQQQILELEVYLKRLELVREQPVKEKEVRVSIHNPSTSNSTQIKRVASAPYCRVDMPSRSNNKGLNLGVDWAITFLSGLGVQVQVCYKPARLHFYAVPKFSLRSLGVAYLDCLECQWACWWKSPTSGAPVLPINGALLEFAGEEEEEVTGEVLAYIAGEEEEVAGEEFTGASERRKEEP
uniref:Glabrous enhancer-binding protein-like DBD domain-containing protein n=1 Tax=Aegilops tauschii TaxID=37682 RepID=N1R1R1_AEGTA